MSCHTCPLSPQIQTQINQFWDQSTVSSTEDLRNFPVPMLQTIEHLVTSAGTNVSDFSQTLPGKYGQREEKCRQFATFIAHLIRLCETQVCVYIYAHVNALSLSVHSSVRIHACSSSHVGSNPVDSGKNFKNPFHYR